MERISVIRGRRLVPLLASEREATKQPWQGVLLERHNVRPGEIPEHSHPDLCLHLQLNGSSDFEWWSEGRHAVERTRPGSLILISPGTTDRLRWTGVSERLVLSFRHDRLAQLVGDLDLPVPPEFLTDWALRDPALEQLITEMGRQVQTRWELGSLYADLLVLGLGTHLLRHRAVDKPALAPRKGGLSLPKLRHAMEFLTANLAEDINLDAVAQELGLSASHFAHEFRGSTGQTPYQYLLDQRMTLAKSMLKDPRWTVQYIAAATGFRSPVNFVRAFRQRVGCTPGEWRKNV